MRLPDKSELLQMKNEPTDSVPVVPRWLIRIGKLSIPVTVFLALDLVYEQTLLTWSRGEQMVGFSVSHLLGPLIFLSVLMSYAFLLGMFLFLLICWLRKRTLPKIPWPLVLTLSVALGITTIPYRYWKYAVFTIKGPGPRVAQTLVYAAHDGDRRMVELLLARGVAVDIDNQGSTALNGACAGGQIEIARWLMSKGADVTHAPNCKDVPLGK
jgi:hypothetical protein